MALTIVERPQGHTLLPTANQATVSSSSGDALFTKAGHGLLDGDFIYIISNIRDYAGFWYVDQQSVNTFKIKKYAAGAFVLYVNNDTVTYYASYITHGWSAVHLPIVYKITSDLWPVNSVDTVRTVTSSSNSFGYTKLVLSGDIKATGSANELDFVKISVNGIEGIYQIIQWISDTNFVIDLTFVGTNTYGNIQFYYQNYHARIKIYAGLTAAHTWAAQKPYQYITELKEVPDSDNLVMVNIAEYLKSQIKILTNDLLLSTLPNDIDSFCQFYISVAESYDISLDGYTIGSYESAFADDSSNLEGVAVNAKLPFRNRHSGYMSDYISGTAVNPAILRKFLTMFEQPTLFDGYYFEVGILLYEGDSTRFIIQESWKNGAYTGTFRATPAGAPFFEGSTNYGVLRVPLTTVSATEDQQKVYLSSTSVSIGSYASQVLIVNVNRDCSKQATEFIWKVWTGGYDTFVFKTQKDYGLDIKDSKESSKSIMGEWPESYGENADTINRETERTSTESLTVYSQNVSETEINGLKFLKTSPLVQVINTKFDKRTVIIDQASFVVKSDGAKTYSITFKASFTDNVPSQSL